MSGFDDFNLIWNLFWKADFTSEDQGDEGIQSLSLIVFYDQLPILIQMHAQKSLLPFMCFTRFGWALAFLMPYVHT